VVQLIGRHARRLSPDIESKMLIAQPAYWTLQRQHEVGRKQQTTWIDQFVRHPFCAHQIAEDSTKPRHRQGNGAHRSVNSYFLAAATPEAGKRTNMGD
jgi:hypothetical protein